MSCTAAGKGTGRGASENGGVAGLLTVCRSTCCCPPAPPLTFHPADGQTGSGKTFTVSGGTERYADRGLIPRALSALFAEAAKRSDCAISLHISYLEIYCEAGYDLLQPGREVQALEDLPRVRDLARLWGPASSVGGQPLNAVGARGSALRACSLAWRAPPVGKHLARCRLACRPRQVHIQEDDEARLHLRNLSLHRCDTEEQALNTVRLHAPALARCAPQTTKPLPACPSAANRQGRHAEGWTRKPPAHQPCSPP